MHLLYLGMLFVLLEKYELHVLTWNTCTSNFTLRAIHITQYIVQKRVLICTHKSNNYKYHLHVSTYMSWKIETFYIRYDATIWQIKNCRRIFGSICVLCT